MLDVGAWAKLTAYVVCIGLVLEFAYHTYWRINRSLVSRVVTPVLRAFFSCACASIPFIAVLVVTGAFCTYMDGQSLRSLGLHRSEDSTLLVACGTTTAFASVSLLFLAGCVLGWFRVERSGVSGDQMPALCGGVCDFSLAAIFEEVALRGYVFSILHQNWGGAAAVTGSAAIFSLFHLVKHPRIPLIFTLNAFFFGVLTAQTRLVTGTLWMPIGLHVGWNLAMGPVFGMPCSGKMYNNGLVTCAVQGPEWLTGGLYSPDAGIIGTTALIVASAALTFFLPM